eukprot:6207254-Pleurochrysis_carterae.AAC.2
MTTRVRARGAPASRYRASQPRRARRRQTPTQGRGITAVVNSSSNKLLAIAMIELSHKHERARVTKCAHAPRSVHGLREHASTHASERARVC